MHQTSRELRIQNPIISEAPQNVPTPSVPFTPSYRAHFSWLGTVNYNTSYDFLLHPVPFILELPMSWPYGQVSAVITCTARLIYALQPPGLYWPLIYEIGVRTKTPDYFYYSDHFSGPLTINNTDYVVDVNSYHNANVFGVIGHNISWMSGKFDNPVSIPLFPLNPSQWDTELTSLCLFLKRPFHWNPNDHSERIDMIDGEYITDIVGHVDYNLTNPTNRRTRFLYPI